MFPNPGSIHHLLTANHHRLILIPEPRIEGNQRRTDGLSLLASRHGKPKLDPDVSTVIAFRSQGHDGIRPLARPLKGACVIDIEIGVPTQIDQQAFGIPRRCRPNPGAPTPVTRLLQFDRRKSDVVEPGQMLPVVNVFPDPFEGHAHKTLIHGTQGQFVRQSAPSPSSILECPLSAPPERVLLASFFIS